MKLTIDRDVLASALDWASRALPARPPVPVLAGVRVRLQADTLTVVAFDYESSATAEVTATLAAERSRRSGRPATHATMTPAAPSRSLTPHDPRQMIDMPTPLQHRTTPAAPKDLIYFFLVMP